MTTARPPRMERSFLGRVGNWLLEELRREYRREVRWWVRWGFVGVVILTVLNVLYSCGGEGPASATVEGDVDVSWWRDWFQR